MRRVALLVMLLLLVPLAASSPARIVGRVVGEDGKGIVGAVVEVYSEGTLVMRTEAGAAGYFTLDLPPGQYLVHVYARGFELKRIRLVVPPGVSSISLGVISLGPATRAWLDFTWIQAEQGSRVSVPLKVVNMGAFRELFSVETAGTPGLDAILQDKTGVVVRQFVLEPGGNRTFYLNVSIAYNATGQGVVRVLLRDTGTHVVNLTVDVIPRNWELVKADVLSASTFPGGMVGYKIVVKNQFSRRTVVKVALSCPTNVSCRVGGSQGSVLLQLEPREERAVNVTVSTDPSTPVGNYTVVVEAEAMGVRSRLDLFLHVLQGFEKIVARTETPVAEAVTGGVASFTIVVENQGISGGIVSLGVEGLPPGYVYTFRDEEGRVVGNVYAPPGGSTKVVLDIRVPEGEDPGTRDFSAVFQGSESTARVNLTLNIAGTKEITPVTQNYLTSILVGSRKRFSIEFRNTGSLSLNRVVLRVKNLPEGLRVMISPPYYEELGPGDTARFDMVIDSDPTMQPGDYYVDLVLTADGIRVERSIRVQVIQRGEVAYAGIVVLLLLMIAMAYVYRRYRER